MRAVHARQLAVGTDVGPDPLPRVAQVLAADAENYLKAGHVRSIKSSILANGETMKLAMAVLAALMFIPAAHADGAPPSIDEVTFTAVFTSVSGATETLMGSFEYEIPSFDPFVVPGTGQVSGSGFLGNFTGPEDLEGSGGYIAFYDLIGDEVDMYLFDVVGDSARMSLFLWGCVSEACQAAIADPGYAGNGPTSLTFTITPQLSEPNFLILLAAGIAFVGLLRRYLHIPSAHGVFNAGRN